MGELRLLLTYMSVINMVNIFLPITILVFILPARKNIPLLNYYVIPTVLILILTILSFISSGTNITGIRFLGFAPILNSSAYLIFIIPYMRRNKETQKRYKVYTIVLIIIFISASMDSLLSENRVAVYDFALKAYFPQNTLGQSIFVLVFNIAFIDTFLRKIGSEGKSFFKEIKKLENLPILGFILFLVVFTVFSIFNSNSMNDIYLISDTFVSSSFFLALVLSIFVQNYKVAPVSTLFIITIFLTFVVVTTFVYLFTLAGFSATNLVEKEQRFLTFTAEAIRKGEGNFHEDVGYVIDANTFEVLYSTLGNKNIFDYPLISTSIMGGHLRRYREIDIGLQNYYVENIIYVNNKSYLVGHSYEWVIEYKADVYKPIFIFLIIILTFCTVIYPLILKHRLLRPIYYLVEKQNFVDRTGNYGIRLYTKGNDEITTIYNTFNKIVENVRKSQEALQNSYDEIRQYNQVLEYAIEVNSSDFIKAYNELVKKKNARKATLDIAQDLQDHLLRTKRIKDINMSIIYEPTESVGGDVYDICKISDNHVRMFLADATGHGIQASLFAILIKTEYDNIKYSTTTEEVFETLNRLFFTRYKEVITFFTSIVVDVFLNERIIKYSSAGHPTQYAIIDGEVKDLPVTQMMVSILEEDYESTAYTFEYKNDYKIILFTDGLFEIKNEAINKLYEEHTLTNIIIQNKDEHIDVILGKMMKNTTDFIGNEKREDDITLIGIENKYD